MRISVVISVYNEEKNIKELLESIKNFADEIIVVDNSSTDDTKKIAENYSDKVYVQKNDPLKIDLQKNFGFGKATGDWILSLDADERLTHELSSEIRSLIDQETSGVVGYWIPRKNIIFGKWIENDMWWPDYQLRLFKRGKGKYENGVHKALMVEGETQKLENFMYHYNYSYVSQYIEKLNNYTSIEAERLLDQGYKFNFLDAVRFPINDFLKIFFFQKGYKDGLHGLVLSFLQAFYMEVVFAKLWEMNKFTEVNSGSFLKEVVGEFKNSFQKFRYWGTTVEIGETKNPIKKMGLKVLRKTKFPS